MTRWAVAMLLVLTQTALASPPDRSLRPELRVTSAEEEVATEGLFRVLRPQARNSERRGFLGVLKAETQERPPVPPETQVAAAVQLPEAFSVLRPKLRTRAVARRAAKQQRTQERTLVAGSVCRNRQIQGVAIGAVPGRLPGCGVASAVRVREVAGVRLSTPAVMDCQTAESVLGWVESAAKPALRRKGGGLKELRVVAHYACRTRNSQPGARISEHGKGKAIDISGFTLNDGSRISVLKGWNDRRHRGALRDMHKKACGPFGTVLGPEANRFHRDHFHFDTASYRSGPYCR